MSTGTGHQSVIRACVGPKNGSTPVRVRGVIESESRRSRYLCFNKRTRDLRIKPGQATRRSSLTPCLIYGQPNRGSRAPDRGHRCKEIEPWPDTDHAQAFR